MITLRVTALNGAPPPAPIAASLGAGGGTIGRNETNQLVLPDPERLVSRVHAQVVFRAGRYVLIDQGSNPVIVNGRPLGNGVESPLADGDEIQIGAYTLRAAVTDDLATPASAPAGADPLGLFGGGPAPAHDPFADLLAPVPPAATATSLPPAEPAPSAGVIPDDWDPFAEPMAAPPPPQRPAAPDLDLGGSSGPSGPSDLDALFGLGGGAASGDPFAGSPLSAAASAPNTAAAADPMASLLGQPKASARPNADSVSELNASFAPPRGVPEPPAAPAMPMAPPTPPAAPAAGRQDIFFSWEGAAEGKTEIHSGAGAAPRPAAVPPVAPPPVTESPVPPIAVSPILETPEISAIPEAAPRGEVEIAGLPSAGATPAGSADTAALLAAFKRGLAAPDLALAALTPETMQLVGALLREATEGTLQLLLARAQTKREVQAEVTMIVARGNNPLKFSPTVEVALGHLLNPPVRGFLPAADAMRDAYDDLRSHEFGFIAGMRAALAGVLARFAPEELEKRLTQRSMLDSLLPASRKARLWELFREMYGQISEEASEDFHSLFGKAFLAAYEEQVDRLKAEDR